VGLALASVGLYGVLSYLVVRRRRELGIRMALGASGGQVRRIVLREGLRLTAIGLVIGTTAALGLARLIRSFLFGFDSVDGIGVAMAMGTMTAVAVLASDLPARRAAATDPVEVLRHD
jgi:ABC-type lipoprotein release transport system permease subunit